MEHDSSMWSTLTALCLTWVRGVRGALGFKMRYRFLRPQSCNEASTPSMSVATRVNKPFTVTALAKSSFHAISPLPAQLKTSTNFRLTSVTATVRPRSTCLALTAQRGNEPSIKRSPSALAKKMEGHCHRDSDNNKCDGKAQTLCQFRPLP